MSINYRFKAVWIVGQLKVFARQPILESSNEESNFQCRHLMAPKNDVRSIK